MATEGLEGAKVRADDTRRALALAKLTDQRFLDPILGLLLPGLGDGAGALIGLYIVVLARKHDLPSGVQAQMLVNLAVDCLGGLVPVVGDVFDLINRANLRNARLLEKHLAPAGAALAPSRQPTTSLLKAGLLLTVALGASGLAIYLGLKRFAH